MGAAAPVAAAQLVSARRGHPIFLSPPRNNRRQVYNQSIRQIAYTPVDTRPAQAHNPPALTLQEVRHEAHSPSRSHPCPRHRRGARTGRRGIRGASLSGTQMPRPVFPVRHTHTCATAAAGRPTDHLRARDGGRPVDTVCGLSESVLWRASVAPSSTGS